MKKWKVALTGFVIGVILTTPALANAYKIVQAQLMHDVLFNINGKAAGSPSNQPVLNYNGYIYVPVRFVSESMDCDVNFDAITKKVTITSPEPEVVEKVVEKEIEKIVYVDKTDDPDYVVYSKLPVTVYKDGYEITLRTVMMDDEDGGGVKRTRTYLTVENTDVNKITVMPYEAKLTLDGVEYDVSNTGGGRWDDAWTNAIFEEEEQEGYILFNGVDYDYSKGTLEFQVSSNDGSGDVIDDIKIEFKR